MTDLIEQTGEPMDLTGEILTALVKSYSDGIWASELAFSGGARRCDFWSISPNSSSGFKAVAHEIKISRADYRRETHAKQREARLFSDQFYYVTPAGLLKPEELPDWAGLKELVGGEIKTRVGAPFLGKAEPSWELVVSLIRNSGEIRRDTDIVRRERLRLKQMLESADAALRKAGLEPWRYGIHV